MKLELFKAEDFEGGDCCGYYAPLATYLAIRANKILNDFIETLPVVYSSNESPVSGVWDHTDHKGNTHQARLICVEEIQKKECEHEPKSYLQIDEKGMITFYPHEMKCGICGKKLKAKWEVCDE